jgi:hypothetical protein
MDIIDNLLERASKWLLIAESLSPFFIKKSRITFRTLPKAEAKKFIRIFL